MNHLHLASSKMPCLHQPTPITPFQFSRHLKFFALTLILCCPAAVAVCQETESDDDEGWVELFNGKDTSGWNNPYEWGEVKVVDNEIQLTASRKFFLVTDEKFDDFVFEGEVMIPEGKANSGFMFRCHAEKNKVFGYQAECDGSDRRWSGGLYDEGRRGWIWPSLKGRTKEEKFLAHAQESQAFFKQEEVAGALDRDGWNKYRITCRGDSIKIEVNGVVTTEIKDDLDASGYIAIQHHGEKGQTYRFRNLRIKELSSE